MQMTQTVLSNPTQHRQASQLGACTTLASPDGHALTKLLDKKIPTAGGSYQRAATGACMPT
jgi:hypothetical protein